MYLRLFILIIGQFLCLTDVFITPAHSSQALRKKHLVCPQNKNTNFFIGLASLVFKLLFLIYYYFIF